jgi:citrate lyase beta subunit
MPSSLTRDDTQGIVADLQAANAAFMKRYPGESGKRQPVHVVYGGAQLFKSDSTVKLGAIGLRTLEQYAPDHSRFAHALGLNGNERLEELIYTRVIEKLQREAVEDFRIDFEDGYGNRTDAEEDGHAESVAREVALGLKNGTLSPFIGIRVKPLNEELRERSIRTLDIFLTTLLQESGSVLPPNFIVTVPKVTIPEQVSFFVKILQRLETKLGLESGVLVFEIMIETPQAILNAEGRSALPLLADAGEGRITGAHFGTYDYTAGVNITAAHQRMQHPACNFARHMMQVAFAGTGIWISDGSTTILPVPMHRPPEGGSLNPDQAQENLHGIHRAWKLHFDDIQDSLMRGFYQGWDLHPGQLPTRYAALYSFFLEGFAPAAERLRNFVNKAAQATLVGEVFDDAATGQGLLNYFLRAINCGAVSEEDVLEQTGLTLDELRGRSFVKIMRNRR